VLFAELGDICLNFLKQTASVLLDCFDQGRRIIASFKFPDRVTCLLEKSFRTGKINQLRTSIQLK